MRKLAFLAVLFAACVGRLGLAAAADCTQDLSNARAENCGLKFQLCMAGTAGSSPDNSAVCTRKLQQCMEIAGGAPVAARGVQIAPAPATEDDQLELAVPPAAVTYHAATNDRGSTMPRQTTHA